jgi:hypothetical protein
MCNSCWEEEKTACANFYTAIILCTSLSSSSLAQAFILKPVYSSAIHIPNHSSLYPNSFPRPLLLAFLPLQTTGQASMLSTSRIILVKLCNYNVSLPWCAHLLSFKSSFCGPTLEPGIVTLLSSTVSLGWSPRPAAVATPTDMPGVAVEGSLTSLGLPRMSLPLGPS